MHRLLIMCSLALRMLLSKGLLVRSMLRRFGMHYSISRNSWKAPPLANSIWFEERSICIRLCLTGSKLLEMLVMQLLLSSSTFRSGSYDRLGTAVSRLNDRLRYSRLSKCKDRVLTKLCSASMCFSDFSVDSMSMFENELC